MDMRKTIQFLPHSLTSKASNMTLYNGLWRLKLSDQSEFHKAAMNAFPVRGSYADIKGVI